VQKLDVCLWRKADIRNGTDAGKADPKKLRCRSASTPKVVEARSESPCREPRYWTRPPIKARW